MSSMNDFVKLEPSLPDCIADIYPGLPKHGQELLPCI